MKNNYENKFNNQRYKFKRINNTDITNDELMNIITLKMTVWNYPKESQLEWINNNVKQDDAHFLMYCENELIGYLCICNVKIEIEFDKFNVFGLSNVCIRNDLQHKGLGTILIKNVFDEYKDKPFVLLTTKKNIYFYSKNGFKIYEGNLFVNGEIDKTSVFFYKNFELQYDKIYIDRSF